MKLRLTNTALCLRPITLADKEMLCQIYSSTRTEEMKLATHWTAEQKHAFLRSQFEAQHHYYQNNYAGAHFWIIEKEGETIGRLYLHPAYGDSMRIIDITLLPHRRNSGIGGQLLKDIIAFADGRDKSVSIHVESFNPAKKLYERLGFRLVSETNGVYHLMERKTTQTVLQ
jgi:N-acetylglutamate synthase-like GNAT family acetyltransferase